MSTYIEVSPLPPDTSIVKVREIFRPFSTQRIKVLNGKAFIEFSDSDGYDTLTIKYDNNTVDELNGAKIIQLDSNFQWPGDQNLNEKENKNQDFNNQTKVEPHAVTRYNAKFIVVAQCDPNILNNTTETVLKNKIFGRYKIGRIIKYNRDLYLEFLDQNQMQLLDNEFPELKVQVLGSQANIKPTDENFDYELVKNQVQEFHLQQNKRKLKQEMAIEQKKKQSEDLMQTIKQRISQEKRQERQTVSTSNSWSVRPEGKRQENRNNSTNLTLFWVGTVVLWGVWVTLS